MDCHINFVPTPKDEECTKLLIWYDTGPVPNSEGVLKGNAFKIIQLEIDLNEYKCKKINDKNEFLHEQMKLVNESQY